MKRLLLTTVLLACVSAQAYAADSKTQATKPNAITVREAIALATALRQLDGKPTGKLDKDNAQIIEPYKFDGATRMTIAIDISHVDQAVVVYQQAKNALIKQLSNGGVSVPTEKQAEFLAQNDKMLDSPAGILVSRIKESDLCLDGKAPCGSANEIPGSVLSQLVPLIDR